MTRNQTDVDRPLTLTSTRRPPSIRSWPPTGESRATRPSSRLSPDGLAQRSQLRRRTLAALAAAHPVDSNDRVTVAALREELELAEQLRATGAEESALNSVASPVQSLRDVFDLMAKDDADDWAVIARRLSGLPTATEQYLASLRLAAGRGRISAARQVER